MKQLLAKCRWFGHHYKVTEERFYGKPILSCDCGKTWIPYVRKQDPITRKDTIEPYRLTPPDAYAIREAAAAHQANPRSVPRRSRYGHLTKV